MTVVGSVRVVDMYKLLTWFGPSTLWTSKLVTLVGFVHFVDLYKFVTLVGSVHYVDWGFDPWWGPSTLW